MGRYTEKLNDIKKLIGKLQKQVPEQIGAFHNFMEAVESTGALDQKHKELVNVGLAVAAQCEWCIALHVQGALKAGATKEEIVEAGMQAVLMHGGPALMYMTPLEEAIEEFTDG